MCYSWGALSGWSIERLNLFFSKHILLATRCDGCAFKLTGDDGKPIKKPWLIMTTNPAINQRLSQFVCKCKIKRHCPCQGKETSRTELYTDVMANEIIDSVVLNHLAPANCFAAVGRDSSESKQYDGVASDLEALLTDSDTDHRQKVGGSCIYNLLGLVTRIIPAHTPEFKSPACQRALEKEVTRLRNATVWDEYKVAEWRDVRNTKKDGKTPMLGDVFPIMGQKNAEVVGSVGCSADDTPMKARAVVQGSFIRAGDGTPAQGS